MAFNEVAKKLLFSYDPESVHNFSNRFLELAGKAEPIEKFIASDCAFSHKSLETEVLGIKFPNPTMLAAGHDKYGKLVNMAHACGMGGIETGGVCWDEQLGEDRPRVFRLIDDKAAINRMGFNNPGVQKFKTIAATWHPKVPVGLNIGKSKATPLDEAPKEYGLTYTVLAPYVDYVTVNVSSPNTPGLRQLQDRGHLEAILKNMRMTDHYRRPILVKIAPDLTYEQIDEVIEVVHTSADGIVAVNTTTSRDNLKSPEHLTSQRGGLSGEPLRKRAEEICAHIYNQFQYLDCQKPIFGVGGIMSADDAYKRIRLGASVIQVLTGIYYSKTAWGGMGFFKEINQGLVKRLERDGHTKISEVIGVEAKHLKRKVA